MPLCPILYRSALLSGSDMKKRLAMILVPASIAAVYAVDHVSRRVRTARTAASAAKTAASAELSAEGLTTAAQIAAAQIDSLFTTIAEGEDSERHQAIEKLHRLLHSGDPQVRLIAMNYPYHFNSRDLSMRAHQSRCALLLRAIPRLIAEVDGKATGAAYGILIYIQPYYPPPDRETWENWWKEEGRAKFAAMAGTL